MCPNKHIPFFDFLKLTLPTKRINVFIKRVYLFRKKGRPFSQKKVDLFFKNEEVSILTYHLGDEIVAPSSLPLTFQAMLPFVYNLSSPIHP